MSAPTLDDVFARSERMVARKIAGEYVLVPLVGRGADLDAIFNLNRVGAFIWEHLDGETPGARVVEALVAHFEVEEARAETDYLEFIAQLQSVRAVTRSGGP